MNRDERPIEITADGQMHSLVSEEEACELERLFNDPSGRALDLAELDRLFQLCGFPAENHEA